MKKLICLALCLAMLLPVVPVQAAEEIIVTTETEGYAEEGAFADSGLKGYNGTKGRYSSKIPAKITYTPDLPQTGMYKVYVYVVKNPNQPDAKNVEKCMVTVKHAEGEDVQTMNFDVLEGWQEVGIYKLYNGRHSYLQTAYTEKEQNGALRAGGARFVLQKAIDEMAPPVEELPFGGEPVIEIPARQSESDGITVRIDGAAQKYDQPAILHNDRTMVPMRGIFEGLDATVSWDDATSTVTGIKGSTRVSLTIGSKTAYINGKTVTLDAEPLLLNDRTLVPVRFISEALGANVDWIEESQTVYISTGAETRDYYLFNYTDFSDLGTWTADGYTGAMNNTNLRGLTNADPGDAKPAVLRFYNTAEGDYKLFVRTRGFTTQPESRYFNISVNGVTLDKTFGQHGIADWAWENGGVLHLPEGEIELQLLDTSKFYARVDALMLTSDETFKDFPTTTEEYVALSESSSYDSGAYFPEWAKAESEPAEKQSISNEQVRIDFLTVSTAQGNVVQKEVYAGNIPVTGRENHLGNLLLYATDAKNLGASAGFNFAEVTCTRKGSITTHATTDLFQSGKPYWMIPNRVEIVSESKAILYASCDVADSVSVWELKEGEREPVITTTVTPKTDGFYSMAFTAGGEWQTNDLDFILSPVFDAGKKLPAFPAVAIEQYVSVPVSQISYTNESGTPVTCGVAVDSSMTTTDWVVEENSRFGLAIRGAGNGAMPALVYPLQGSDASKRTVGESFSFAYRRMELPSDWFETFSHAVTDIYNLTDYRENYYGGLTDTVFNTTKLALDEKYSGWDEKMMLHYNIEGKYSASQANPMVYLSSYLLSEDEEMLTRRAIPSLAYLLTRSNLHFSRSTVKGSGNPGLVFDKATEIGQSTRAFGTSVLGGIYQMTGGYNDIFKELGYEKGAVYYNLYGSTPKFTEYAWAYKYTGNEEYLKIAKEEADRYIENNINNPRTDHPDFSSFIAISYYPNFQALLDLYEICGDEKYLDASVKAAQLMLTTVWVSPVADTQITVSADKIREQHFNQGNMGANYYYGEAWRIGYPDELERLTDETVPFWLVSRTGLSIEQASTFKQHNSGNMIMTNWAADLMRLYAYTGNELFETYARNAVIGRYTNYPGYYYNQYETVQMKPDYPYTGPDITGIYWHHIPPFLSMIQDFLFTQAVAWSGKEIDFPSVRQQGYAYFSSREYGGSSGRIYDESDMWLWLKEGLIEEDNLQIDWFAARKNGTAAIVFMNEGKQDEAFSFKLGSDIAGGNYSGSVTLYAKDGTKTEGVMENGAMTVSVPAHSLVTVMLKSPAVTAPAYAAAKGTDVDGKTAVTGENFGGYLLQVTPSVYHAYLFTTAKAEETKKAVFYYKIGSGAWQQKEIDAYPFETIIECRQSKESFTFYAEITDNSGKVIKTDEQILVPETK